MTVKRTIKETKNILDKLNLMYLNEYRVRYVQRVIVKDDTGYKYDVTLESIKRGSFPEAFNKKNPFSLENIALWLLINNKTFFLHSENLYLGNKELLLFKCNTCKENFYMSWDNIFHNHGCSVCAGFQVGLKNSLGYLIPELVDEWVSSENDLTPFDVTITSKEKAVWKCKNCGSEQIQEVRNKLKSRGCKICSGYYLSDNNRLSTLEPEISSEWDYNKNKTITPYDIKCSCKNKFWWKCSGCDNSWEASPRHRTWERSGCPKCKSPKGEKSVIKNINQLTLDFTHQKYFTDCRNTKPLPFDFYLPDYSLCIEYHGIQHYEVREFFGGEEGFRKRQINDKIKEDYCKNNNINLLIIPYWEFDNIERILKETLSQLEGSTA